MPPSPARPAPRVKMEQHRLGLIVGGVGHEHGARAAAAGNPREEVVASGSRPASSSERRDSLASAATSTHSTSRRTPSRSQRPVT